MSKNVATSNDFFKKHKITIEIGEIKVKWGTLTVVILVAMAVEKTVYAI